jgi:exonuclease VII large subunit
MYSPIFNPNVSPNLFTYQEPSTGNVENPISNGDQFFNDFFADLPSPTPTRASNVETPSSLNEKPQLSESLQNVLSSEQKPHSEIGADPYSKKSPLNQDETIASYREYVLKMEEENLLLKQMAQNNKELLNKYDQFIRVALETNQMNTQLIQQVELLNKQLEIANDRIRGLEKLNRDLSYRMLQINQFANQRPN